jgi:hypothetical protein
VSAPTLPDNFGNYALGDIVEVVSPADVSYLPQTAAWAWLGALLLALLLRFCWRRLRRWYRNRYRREAVARLSQLARDTDRDSWLVELNKLLKLTALAAFSHEQVARLSGEEWVDFLNGHCASPPFSAKQRSLLATGVYSSVTLADTTREQLLSACLYWVRHHQSTQHV